MHSPAPLDALLRDVAFAPLPGVAWLRITGEDRLRWLNGMTTNNVLSLGPGQGCYSFFLNAQGRIQHDATIFAEPHSVLLETSAEQLTPLMAMLDRYIIMDDVELTPLPGHAGLLLAGPAAASTLQTLELPIPEAGTSLIGDADARLDVLRTASPLVPRFELWSAAQTIATWTGRLAELGIAEASPEALHALRVLEGTPLLGADIRDRDLPQETAPAGTQSRALHFGKGCYLGQEIVERIHSRGNLHRTFSGFVLTGAAPPPGTMLTAPAFSERPVGEVTSIAAVSHGSGTRLLALGYIRRDALDRGEAIGYEGGTAQPSSLPFRTAD